MKLYTLVATRARAVARIDCIASYLAPRLRIGLPFAGVLQIFSDVFNFDVIMILLHIPCALILDGVYGHCVIHVLPFAHM